MAATDGCHGRSLTGESGTMIAIPRSNLGADVALSTVGRKELLLLLLIIIINMSIWKIRKKNKKTSKFADTGMGEKGINNREWIDREEWIRKIKL